jgi:hypothetical protein
MLLPKLYDNWEDIRLIVHHQRYKPSDSSKNDIVHLKSLFDKTASSAFYLVTTNKEIPLKYSEQKFLFSENNISKTYMLIIFPSVNLLHFNLKINGPNVPNVTKLGHSTLWTILFQLCV